MPELTGILVLTHMKICYSLLLIFIPNIFFCILASALSVDRALISLDYLIATAFLALNIPWFGITLFLIAITADLLTIISQIFVFANLQHLFYLSKFLFQAPFEYKFYSVVSIFLIVIFVAFSLRLAKSSSALFCLVFLNVGILAYYIEDSSKEPELKSVRMISKTFVDSPTLHNFNNRTSSFFSSHNENENKLIKIASASALDEWRGEVKLPNKLLFIVNESWGLHLNPEVQRLVEKPLSSLESKGFITTKGKGSLKFTGATVDAELRELCKLSTSNFNLGIVEEGFEECLPNELAQRGYQTKSLHSASGVLYDRISWYPKAGFQTSEFFENHFWPRRCYSYPGGCDFDAINFIADDFNKHSKIFFYWLTLNSHAVYDKRDIIINNFSCEEFEISPESQTCRNLSLQNQFFTVLANSISNGEFKGAEVLIVSDHQPIITNLEERDNNFQYGEIPWIRFTIN